VMLARDGNQKPASVEGSRWCVHFITVYSKSLVENLGHVARTKLVNRSVGQPLDGEYPTSS
jgi:hypothetical protein